MLALLPTASVAGEAHRRLARSSGTSHVLRSTDIAYLRYDEAKSEGSNLYEEGAASGTLPGSMHVYADVGPRLTASFTIFIRGGIIYGRGLANSHGSGTYESFAGTLTATGGTGLYAHAHGRAGLYGVLNRRTYAMTVQTTGTLFY
jgi:hypothetical protein